MACFRSSSTRWWRDFAALASVALRCSLCWRFCKAGLPGEGGVSPGARLEHEHCSSRLKESTSAGEKETCTCLVSPGASVPCVGETEKGASDGGSGSRSPSAAQTLHL